MCNIIKRMKEYERTRCEPQQNVIVDYCSDYDTKVCKHTCNFAIKLNLEKKCENGI